MAEPDALELQAHAITTAMESAHKIIVEDFWQRDGRAWLKYWAQPDGPMWVVTIEPWSKDGTAEDELERLRAEVEHLRATEATEWGVRFTIGSRYERSSPDEAEARSVVAEMQRKHASWNACLVQRTPGRPAGPWTEVTEEAPDA